MKDPYTNKQSLPYKFRKNRSKYIKEIIDQILSEKEECNILDIGGTEQYWNILIEYMSDKNISIDISNISGNEAENKSRFRFIAGDARNMSEFADNSYDFVHSNSVIEHVGDWSAMKQMAANVKRLARRYYVQTPNFWFPYEPHFRSPFYHWLPEQLRFRLLMHMTLGFRGKQDTIDGAMEQVQSVQLLDRRQFSALFDDAEIINEKFLLFTKSLIAIRK